MKRLFKKWKWLEYVEAALLIVLGIIIICFNANPNLHDDHLHNINLFKDKEIIVSKQTAKYVKFTSQLFIEKTTIDLGNYLVTIDNLPNSHGKGEVFKI